MGAEAKDRNGCTALMFAAASGNEELARTLINGGVNADAENTYGQTAYDYACQFNQDSLIDLLAPIEVEEADEEEEQTCLEDQVTTLDSSISPVFSTSADSAPSIEMEA